MTFCFGPLRHAKPNLSIVRRLLFDRISSPQTVPRWPQKCYYSISANLSEQNNDAKGVPVTNAVVKSRDRPTRQAIKGNWKWSPADDALLCRMHHEEHPRKMIAKALGRSIGSIAQRVLVKGLNKNAPAFTPEEDNIILANATQKASWRSIHQKLPFRSRGSLQNRYYLLLQSKPENNAKKGEHNLWTSAEDALIQELRNKRMNWKDMAKHFPGRTRGAIRGRYSRLVPREKRMALNPSWTKKQREQVLALRAEGHTLQNIAIIVGRTTNSIVSLIRRMGADAKLASDAELNNGKKWSRAEVAQLLEMRDRNCTIGEMMRVLNRTLSAVEQKLISLELDGSATGGR